MRHEDAIWVAAFAGASHVSCCHDFVVNRSRFVLPVRGGVAVIAPHDMRGAKIECNMGCLERGPSEGCGPESSAQMPDSTATAHGTASLTSAKKARTR